MTVFVCEHWTVDNDIYWIQKLDTGHVVSNCLRWPQLQKSQCLKLLFQGPGKRLQKFVKGRAGENVLLTVIPLTTTACKAEEVLNWKTSQRSSRWIGGQNPCRASFCVSVFLKQTVELNRRPCCTTVAVLPRSFWNKRLNSTISFKKTKAKQLVRQGFCPPIWRDNLCLFF